MGFFVPWMAHAGGMIVSSPIESRGIQRVVSALEARPNDAPVRVFHVNGRVERLYREIAMCGDDYAIVQYVLRSSQKPHTSEWLSLWRDAMVVWSYYDLPALCAEDGVEADFNFYRAPLGIDPVFNCLDCIELAPEEYMVLTHGDYLAQSVRECFWASQAVGVKMAHLAGERFKRPEVDFFEDLTDKEMVRLYSRCRYVCGLRRAEGFELPAVEGLACGARPILFDREHYRHWYGDHAEYVEEVDRAGVIEQLRDLFLREPRPVIREEQEWAVATFDWDAIIGGFYESIAAA